MELIEKRNAFLENLVVDTSKQSFVIFQRVDSNTIKELLDKLKIDNIGITESANLFEEEHLKTGKVKSQNGDKNFIVVLRRAKDVDIITIGFENAYYKIVANNSNDKRQIIRYLEKIEQNGSTEVFSCQEIEKDNYIVKRTVISGNSRLTETSGECVNPYSAIDEEITDYEFRNYAQPECRSNNAKKRIEWLNTYKNLTNLEIIEDEASELEEIQSYSLYYVVAEDDFNLAFQNKRLDEKEVVVNRGVPYIVSIEKIENDVKRKVKLLYTSLKAYKNGEKPYMIYLDDGKERKEYSGIFRLDIESGDYFDNKSFNGRKIKMYNYEDVKKIIGDMSINLSDKSECAVINFNISPLIKKIYDMSLIIFERDKKILSKYKE